MEAEEIGLLLDESPDPIHYADWVRVYYETTVHTHGRVPFSLRIRRPNEPPETEAYRISIFKPVTKADINRAGDNLCRIVSDNGFGFAGAPPLVDYVLQHQFDGHMFRDYFSSKVLRFDVEDPNGFLVWHRKEEEVFDEDGDFAGYNFDVDPLLIKSPLVRYVDKDTLIYADPDLVDVDGKMNDIGSLENLYALKCNRAARYFVVSKTGMYVVEEIKKGEMTRAKNGQFKKETRTYWKVTPQAEYEIPIRPAFVLGGNWLSAGYYESWFAGFVPFADEALMRHSDHQAVDNQFSFPMREERTMKCPNKDCLKGEVPYDNDGVTGMRTCPTCHGQRQIIVRSPYGTYLTPDAATGIDDKSNGATRTPAVQLHHADVGILNYSKDAWKTYLELGGKAIYLVQIEQAQSAVAKDKDQEGRMDMLRKVINNYYDRLMQPSLQAIQWLMFGDLDKRPRVDKPNDLRIKGSDELVAELKAMMESGLPKSIIKTQVLTFVRKQFSEFDPIRKTTEVLMQFDRYYVYSFEEKTSMLAFNIITREQFDRSEAAGFYLDRIAEAHGSDYVTIAVDALVDELEKVIDKELKPLAKVDMPKQLPLRDANGNPVDPTVKPQPNATAG